MPELQGNPSHITATTVGPTDPAVLARIIRYGKQWLTTRRMSKRVIIQLTPRATRRGAWYFLS